MAERVCPICGRDHTNEPHGHPTGATDATAFTRVDMDAVRRARDAQRAAAGAADAKQVHGPPEDKAAPAPRERKR